LTKYFEEQITAKNFLSNFLCKIEKLGYQKLEFFKIEFCNLFDSEVME